ncbi:protein fam188a-like [Nannochloropsis oceanica]
MRKARLRALGQQQGGGSGKEIEGNGPPETEEEGWMVVDATDLPPSNPSASPAAPAATASSDGRPMTDAEMDAIRGLMWPPSATGDDLSRWHNQGFIFPPSLPPSLTFGLAQGQGGPCGVLAAVQGEVVRLLVFEGRDEHGKEGGEEEGVEGGKEDAALPTPDAAGALQALARALIHVLERARPTERELEEEGVGSNSSSSSNNSSSSSSTDSSNNKNNNSSRSERGQIYLVTPSLPPSLPSSLPPSFASSSSSSFVLSPHTPPRELEIRTFPHAQAAVEFLTERGGLAPFQVGREEGVRNREGAREGGREGLP